MEERIEDLVSRMSLEEKIAQLSYDAPAIDRLELSKYNWWNECLHGVARAGRATVFPQAIGMAATFDKDLMFKVGDVISTEGRAKYNVFTAKGHRNRYQGLTFWSPNVNIFRDPRWGRGQETYGEDPYLTAQLGVQFVKGLTREIIQNTLKQQAWANTMPYITDRRAYDTNLMQIVSQKDLWETYLPAFEALVKEAKVEGMMGAYNRTNGKACCAHDYLMGTVLRDQWGFDGYFVSDCWALVDFYSGHNIVATAEEAAAMALNVGCNLNCGSTYPALKKAIEEGLTSESVVDENLKQLLKTRFRLGLFDPSGSTPWDDYGPDLIRHPDHVQLSLEAATKSMVLLKNDQNTLPLTEDINGVYVVGPTATHAQALLANYYGLSEDMTTILEGLVGNAWPHTSVRYSQGALLDEPNRNPVDWFSGDARNFDVTVVCLGISQLIEGEEGEAIASRHQGDRVDIGLPSNQIELLRKMKETSNKLVVVVTGGSAIALSEVYDLGRCPDFRLVSWRTGWTSG